MGAWPFLHIASNLTWTSQGKKTLLHEVARWGRIALVRPLLDQGSNINEKDVYGWTPIFLACKEQKKDMALLLATFGADPTIASNEVTQRNQYILTF